MRLLLFPLKHSQRCGSVDRRSMPALASWLGTGRGVVRSTVGECERESVHCRQKMEHGSLGTTSSQGTMNQQALLTLRSHVYRLKQKVSIMFKSVGFKAVVAASSPPTTAETLLQDAKALSELHNAVYHAGMGHSRWTACSQTDREEELMEGDI